MDYFAGKQPDLIGPIMKKAVGKITHKAGNNSTVSDKISNFMGDYIYENKLIVLILVLFFGFLIYRYYHKKNNNTSNKDEPFANQDYNMIHDIAAQTDYLRYDVPPSFNPIRPVNDQKEHVYYPPDPLPINIPGKGFVYTRNIYGEPLEDKSINSANYDYSGVYKYPTRSYYSGTHDTYENAQDTDIINPLGFPNDFNTRVGNFGGKMTDANNQNINDYQNILDDKEGNMIQALVQGGGFDKPPYDFDPPFAVD